MENYQKAANYYAGEHMAASNLKMLTKVAEIEVTVNKNYAKAAQICELIGTEYLKNNLLKFGSKDHFWKAILCYFALGDLTMAKQKMTDFAAQDLIFKNSREYAFCQDSLNAMEQDDASRKKEIITEFSVISKVPEWYIYAGIANSI